ncbi:MAG: phosphoglucosamine mutase [Chloracidobacterium sp.]|nr:phosphoglucosamine mutase [Chloracidobacterium sp.]
MEKLFGTDGIRGEAGVFPLDEKTVEMVGASVAGRFKERAGRPPKIVIGRDTRESGPWIEEAFSRGAAAGGAECESAGVMTTPGVAFVNGAFGFDLGVVISASHNPFYDNGIKIFLPDGRKIDDQFEHDIETDVHNGIATGSSESATTASGSDEGEFRRAYLAHLEDVLDGARLDGLKAVVDCANGAASKLAPRLFSGLGLEIAAINDNPNGRNINADCGSLHLDGLRRKVVESGADIGIAFDGDADRSLFVDELGDVVDGDATLWILASRMEREGELKSGRVVATVMSNIGLELALRSRSIELARTSVGDKYVLDELIGSGGEIGGEQSGHLIFPKRSLVGDGMMTALLLLKTMKDAGQPLSNLTEGFDRYPQVLVNVPVGRKVPFDDVEPVKAEARRVEASLSGNGRLLLRYSGTENLARVMIEGRNQDEIDGLAHGLADTIKAALS